MEGEARPQAFQQNPRSETVLVFHAVGGGGKRGLSLRGSELFICFYMSFVGLELLL